MIGNMRLSVCTCVLSVLWFASAVDAGSDTQQANKAATTDAVVNVEEIDRILAVSDDIEYGEYLASECASCHSAETVEGSNVPLIHGAEPALLVQALLEYRNGTRSNTTMGTVAKGLDDEEIAVIVHYLSSVAP